jgi:hypothetical protein
MIKKIGTLMLIVILLIAVVIGKTFSPISAAIIIVFAWWSAKLKRR